MFLPRGSLLPLPSLLQGFVFVPNTVYFAWLRYDGLAKRLHIFLNNNSTRPGTPYLVAPLDLAAVLGSSSAYVALTGGSSTYWQWPTEHHYIYNLSVASGARHARRALPSRWHRLGLPSCFWHHLCALSLHLGLLSALAAPWIPPH